MNTDSIEYKDGVAIGVTSKSDPAFGIKKEVIEASTGKYTPAKPMDSAITV